MSGFHVDPEPADEFVRGLARAGDQDRGLAAGVGHLFDEFAGWSCQGRYYLQDSAAETAACDRLLEGIPSSPGRGPELLAEVDLAGPGGFVSGCSSIRTGSMTCGTSRAPVTTGPS